MSPRPDADRIRELNDALRTTFQGGRVTMTAGVAALLEPDVAALLGKVRTFDVFTPDNDPHGEHDFGIIVHGGTDYMWKIDYYNLGLDGGSEDPSDPSQTTRVLTVMRADEY